MDLSPPFFLIALPQLANDFFTHAVILIVRHDTEGAEGVLVNRILFDEEEGPALMRAEIKDLEGKLVSEFNEPLLEGGPVKDESIGVLHNSFEVGQNSTSLGQGLFLTTDPALFQTLLEDDSPTLKRRFFLGRCGWAAGQLDAELRTGTWFPTPVDASLIFLPLSEDKVFWGDDLWTRALNHAGVSPFTLMGQGSGDAGSN